MNRKRSEPDDVKSSSEDEDEKSGEESSSEEDDEFDSEDDRVNIIPGQDTKETPSETRRASTEEESSSESDEEDDAMKVDTNAPVDVSHPHTPQNVQTFDSDVEAEYETGSTSESEGLTQERAKDVVQGTPIEAMSSQKKVQESRAMETTGKLKAGDEVVKNGKNKAATQQQKDSPPSRPAKGEILKNLEDDNQPAKKGQERFLKDIASDDSVRNDKKLGTFLKKRKIESSLLDAEGDSANSAPILRKRKDPDMVHIGKKSAPKDKVSQPPSETGFDDPSASKKGADRDEPSHSLVDVGKEIARKTLNNTAVIANGSKDAPDSKMPAAGHESKQGKKANSSAAKQPALSSKQKKLPHVWSVDEEIIMASEVLNRVKMGLEVPSKRNDDFWGTLSEILLEKLAVEFSRDQLCEKARRMKQKYQGTVQKIEESRASNKPFKHKNNGEQRLFDIFSQIWGRVDVTSLEDQQAANISAGKDSKKPIQSQDREVGATNVSSPKAKATNVSSPKARPSAKANVGKIEAAAIIEDGDAKVNKVAATLTKLKEDKERVIILQTPADSSASPIHNVEKLLQDKIDGTLHELKEWTKRNLEEWMSKAYARIEDSLKRREDQVRRTSWMGMAGGGGGLPIRFCNGIDVQLMQGDESYQQRCHELQLQELNVHAQKLELMRKECELKQEQIKVELQQAQMKK